MEHPPHAPLVSLQGARVLGGEVGGDAVDALAPREDRSGGVEQHLDVERVAARHGARVGANMAGAAEPYDHLPFFYSDLFDLGYEAVGEVDARLATVAEWAEPHRKGIVGYVDGEGRARGFLLWDVWGQVDDARALIRDGAEVDGAVLRALLG